MQHRYEVGQVLRVHESRKFGFISVLGEPEQVYFRPNELAAVTGAFGQIYLIFEYRGLYMKPVEVGDNLRFVREQTSRGWMASRFCYADSYDRVAQMIKAG